MKITSTTRRIIVCLPLATLPAAGVIACGPETPHDAMIAKRVDGLEFSYTQPSSLPTTTTNPFSGTPTSPYAGSGYYNSSGTGNGDIYACRDCSYTNWIDLGSSLRGQEQSRNLNTTLSTALGTYASSLWSYGTNDGLEGRMDAAESLVSASFDGSYASGLFETIEAVASLMELFPPAVGKVTVTEPSPKTWAISFKPNQARARTLSGLNGYVWQPVLLRQTRFRGARSYCAMREAARAQRESGDTLVSLGAQSIDSWWFWDVGNGETTVKIAGPVQVGKELQTPVSSTGANAYVIPIAVGAQVTPLKGPLFPTLPEVVHPLVWVTGDAEVQSHEGSYSYVNSQHADFWTGQYVEGAGVHVQDVILFSWGGLIDLKATGDLVMTMGKPVDGACGSGVHSDLGDGRGGWSSGATCTTAPGLLSRSQSWDPVDGLSGQSRPSAYASDAPLGISDYAFLPFESDGAHWPWRAPLPVGWGMNERWLANDDRSVVLADSVHEELSLSVVASLDFGPLGLGITALGSISITTTQLTTVRDHMSLSKGQFTLPSPYTVQNPSGNAILPQTSFVVTSETQNVTDFDPLTLTSLFDLVISLGFGDIEVHWAQPFFELDGSSETDTGPFTPEHRRLRVGQYSDWGTDFSAEGSTGRVVMSHLPDPSDPPELFASFPNGTGEPRDVPICLADTTVEDDPPPPRLGVPPTYPSGEVCWYGPSSPCWTQYVCTGVRDFCQTFNGWQLPANACNPTVKAQWLSQFSSPELDCFEAMLDYLCSGTHKQQNWGQDGSVIAHVYDQSEEETVASVIQACVTDLIVAENPTTETQAQCLAERFGQYFKLGACKDDATLDGNPP